jgi:hypothetical protein
MRARLAAALLLSTFLGAGGYLLACGDKFLVVSRNTRYKHASLPRAPAAILIYANPASNLPRALANVPVEATLRKAGYQPTSVAGEKELDEALARGRWELIVADQAECESLRGRLSGDAAAALLPVFYNATRVELQQARKRYACLIESPTKNQAFLDTIDEAVALRPHSRTPGTAPRTAS